jgi:hypothetical protein
MTSARGSAGPDDLAARRRPARWHDHDRRLRWCVDPVPRADRNRHLRRADRHRRDDPRVYTYAGDVNFDGLVDASDYGIIDNYFQFPGTTGYANGDFNYDGVIDAGDYGSSTTRSSSKGAPIPMTGGVAEASSLSGVTAVPSRLR